MKVYHTNYDTPVNVSRYLLKYAGEFILNFILALDPVGTLPYDFPPILEILENCLSSRLDRMKGIINVSKALEETRKLKALIREFNRLREAGSEKGDAKFNNKSQLEICSLLNTTIMGTGGDANKTAAWVISEYLDMLITLRTAKEALRSNNLELAVKSLGSLRTMSWGLNVNLNTYNETFDLMLKSARYPGIYPNLMAELLYLKEKMGDKNIDISKVTSSLDKEYNLMVGRVADKISDLENAIAQSCRKLTKMTRALHI
jgi:hypothetical protein